MNKQSSKFLFSLAILTKIPQRPEHTVHCWQLAGMTNVFNGATGSPAYYSLALQGFKCKKWLCSPAKVGANLLTPKKEERLSVQSKVWFDWIWFVLPPCQHDNGYIKTGGFNAYGFCLRKLFVFKDETDQLLKSRIYISLYDDSEWRLLMGTATSSFEHWTWSCKCQKVL